MEQKDLYLTRQTLQTDRTFGEITWEQKHLCWTLEDEDRGLHSQMTPEEIKEFKVYGKTAIPAGRYQLELLWSPHFKKQMVHLINVTGYSGVLLHGGNTEADSLGCPLCAFNKYEDQGRIQGSAEAKIFAIVKDQISKGIEMYITIN